jgi:hypothetical protein
MKDMDVEIIPENKYNFINQCGALVSPKIVYVS